MHWIVAILVAGTLFPCIVRADNGHPRKGPDASRLVEDDSADVSPLYLELVFVVLLLIPPLACFGIIAYVKRKRRKGAALDEDPLHFEYDWGTTKPKR